ncbi:MAG: T9SS C-terminal target domain-containing protein, partial [Candidatus Hydrogenedentota bacterium]
NVNRTETVTITNNPDTQTGQVVIPAGAFPSAADTAQVFIIVSFEPSTPFDTALPGTNADVWDALEVKLSNGDTQLANGETATVTMTFRDDNNDGFVDGTQIRWNTLKIYRHTGVAGDLWEERPTIAKQDPANGQPGWLKTWTEHFSIFRLVGVGASVNLSNVVVGPNPFRPNDGNPATGANYTGAAGTGIFFGNLPAQVEIEVFSLSGRRVFRFSTTNSTGQVQWDVRNGDGQDVASGVYLWRIKDTSTGETRTGKLTVIR